MTCIPDNLPDILEPVEDHTLSKTKKTGLPLRVPFPPYWYGIMDLMQIPLEKVYPAVNTKRW